MANAEVFCLPSRVEPFGIVVIEALRAGRPVVVSSRGGAPEIVRHEREGLVADPFDTGAYGAAISRLLGDGDLAARLSAAGRQRVNDFSWSNIADQYRALYRELR
jgi:glycosyltransferase involved in cell wall biosynthesis